MPKKKNNRTLFIKKKPWSLDLSVHDEQFFDFPTNLPASPPTFVKNATAPSGVVNTNYSLCEYYIKINTIAR